jgi:hypothetical protein
MKPRSWRTQWLSGACGETQTSTNGSAGAVMTAWRAAWAAKNDSGICVTALMT